MYDAFLNKINVFVENEYMKNLSKLANSHRQNIVDDVSVTKCCMGSEMRNAHDVLCLDIVLLIQGSCAVI